jgi:hypothetical protein
VRGGCETDKQQPRARIAEAGHGPAPVRIETMRPLLLLGDAATVLSEPRASLA